MAVSTNSNHVVSVNEDELIYTLITSRRNPIAKDKLDIAFDAIKLALNNINETHPVPPTEPLRLTAYELIELINCGLVNKEQARVYLSARGIP